MNWRETKSWSYGVRTQVTGETNRVSWIASAPVHADRTGDSIKELQSDLTAFLGDKGVTKEELQRTVNGSVRELPDRSETSRDVPGGVRALAQVARTEGPRGGKGSVRTVTPPGT